MKTPSLISWPQSFIENLEKSSFVMLGECDHWINEKYQYQIDFISRLKKLGFNKILIERGYLEILLYSEHESFTAQNKTSINGILAMNPETKNVFKLRFQKSEQKF